MQQAVFHHPVAPTEAVANRPSVLRLPLPDHNGNELWRSFHTITHDSAARWAPHDPAGAELFDLIVVRDRAAIVFEDRKALADLWASRHDLVPSDDAYTELQRDVNEFGREVGGAERRLAALLETGLKVRTGTRLVDNPDLNVFLQIASRVRLEATLLHVCERCDVVFCAKRRILQNLYLCRDCKGKRVPRLRPASAFRQCIACGALFEPIDVQQSTCPQCKSTKSRRSRNPGRPVSPGTPLQRATLELALDL